MFSTHLFFAAAILLMTVATVQAQTLSSSQDTTIHRTDAAKEGIRIICVSSLKNGNEPLHIIDGTPVTEEQLKALDPNRIKKINVLKGLEATAIYGSRGANGAIIITTKRRFRVDNVLRP